MKTRPYIPLLAKVLGWLALHLTLLVLAFVGFVGWQLGLGLDSLLSGSAGERLKAFGDAAREEMLGLRPPEWNAAIAKLARERDLTAAIFNFENPAGYPVPVPKNVIERTRTAIPTPPGPSERRGPPRELSGGRQREGDFPEGARPPPFGGLPRQSRPGLPNENIHLASRPVFLVRGRHGDGYWAGVQLTLPGKFGLPSRQELLLIRADGLDGSGMFFDFKPWLWGGLAVLALSLVFWAPFVWGITRYIRKLTGATESISAGHFEISLPARGNDELGNLGIAIQTMAGRLDHFVSGQKRFLGDAAHELCAPLARLRTGLGILEVKLGDADQEHLASIEADAQELATLIEELLAFSRASHRATRKESVLLEPLIGEIANRESGENPPHIIIPNGLAVTADPTLLGRALGNLIRNARIHAGPAASITIQASERAEFIEIEVSDDGPGVAPEELARLFEPFYRPDRSRSRDTGGSGLGLTIVRTAMEACGGEAFASLPLSGGFAVTLRFRNARAGS
jgi:two-component system, OmpR family, sensor histidine kinase CpxA